MAALPWLFLALLMALSGLLSASETALFSLAPTERRRAGHRVEALLEHPREVLLSVLLGNLLVNLLFFTSVPVLVGGGEGALARIAESSGALLAILVGGEILPKTVALRAPLLVARIAALPISLFVAVLEPVRGVVGRTLDVALRTLGETERHDPGVTSETLALVLEQSSQQGLLAPGEADLLAEIVELRDLRVREIMTPRVDAWLIDLEDSPEERQAVQREARRGGAGFVVVTRGGADNVVGQVSLRDLLLHPDRPLEALVMPIKFVPEVATALGLLTTLRQERASEAVVVDEWGGTAGVVTLEDLFEELVGDLRTEGETGDRPVVPIGEGRFRVSGGLSIRDWNERFGTSVVRSEFDTVGGFVVFRLGRIPRVGDRVELGAGLVCEVREVRDRRVATLDIWVGGPEDVPATAGERR